MNKYFSVKNAIKLAKDYVKAPYFLLSGMKYEKGWHTHICFARRLLLEDWKEVCPYYNAAMRDDVEWADCCDHCKYFGAINFERDVVGNKQISFYMSNKIVEIFGGEYNEEDSEN